MHSVWSQILYVSPTMITTHTHLWGINTPPHLFGQHFLCILSWVSKLCRLPPCCLVQGRPAPRCSVPLPLLSALDKEHYIMWAHYPTQPTFHDTHTFLSSIKFSFRDGVIYVWRGCHDIFHLFNNVSQPTSVIYMSVHCLKNNEKSLCQSLVQGSVLALSK